MSMLHARARERHPLGQDGAHRRRGQGRAQSAARRHGLASDVEVGEATEHRARRGLHVAARPRGHRRDAGARRRRQGEHRADDRRGSPEAAGRSSSARPRCRPTGSRLSVQGELTLGATTRPIAFELDGRRGRQAQRRRRRQAERLGDHALLDAVRHAEGRRRGRGRARRRACRLSRCRRSARRARPRPRAAGRRCRARRGRGPRPS